MALKRKRSSPAFSSPASDASDASDATPQSCPPLSFFYHASKPVDVLLHKPTWSWPTYDDSPAHLNSRTRKRHRDNRPEEAQVRENTINRLFAAQRQHPHAEPVLSQAVTPVPSTHPQRSTLHSFWKLPKATVPMLMDEGSVQTEPSHARCEDCDRRIQVEDAMDLDDGIVGQESRCQTCLRQVCDMCAVLGVRRVCLQCASAH